MLRKSQREKAAVAKSQWSERASPFVELKFERSDLHLSFKMRARGSFLLHKSNLITDENHLTIFYLTILKLKA